MIVINALVVEELVLQAKKPAWQKNKLAQSKIGPKLSLKTFQRYAQFYTIHHTFVKHQSDGIMIYFQLHICMILEQHNMYIMLQILNLMLYLSEIAIHQNTPEYIQPLVVFEANC